MQNPNYINNFTVMYDSEENVANLVFGARLARKEEDSDKFINLTNEVSNLIMPYETLRKLNFQISQLIEAVDADKARR